MDIDLLLKLNNTTVKLNNATNKKYDFAGPGSAEDTSYVDIKFPITSKQEKATAATIAITPLHANTFIEVAASENMTITAVTTNAKLGDRLTVKLNNDAGGARTVTFGSNFKASATVVGTASKYINVSFIFDGTNFIETGRTAAITP